MNLYTILANAKDELRRAKDHEQTIRAIAEFVELSGKNADDRKRELAYVLSQSKVWRDAQNELRDAELAVDTAQAAIDQAEAERRDREWRIRARLAAALSQHHVADEDTVPDWLQDKRMERDLRDPVHRAQAQREMDELFST